MTCPHCRGTGKRWISGANVMQQCPCCTGRGVTPRAADFVDVVGADAIIPTNAALETACDEVLSRASHLQHLGRELVAAAASLEAAVQALRSPR